MIKTNELIANTNAGPSQYFDLILFKSEPSEHAIKLKLNVNQCFMDNLENDIKLFILHKCFAVKKVNIQICCLILIATIVCVKCGLMLVSV